LSTSIGVGGDWCGSKQPRMKMDVGVLERTRKWLVKYVPIINDQYSRDLEVVLAKYLGCRCT
jgi:hypothetical protein